MNRMITRPMSDKLFEQNMKNVLEIEKDQARKEARKEVLQDVYRLSKTITRIHPLDVLELADKYGVEVDDE